MISRIAPQNLCSTIGRLLNSNYSSLFLLCLSFPSSSFSSSFLCLSSSTSSSPRFRFSSPSSHSSSRLIFSSSCSSRFRLFQNCIYSTPLDPEYKNRNFCFNTFGRFLNSKKLSDYLLVTTFQCLLSQYGQQNSIFPFLSDLEYNSEKIILQFVHLYFEDVSIFFSPYKDNSNCFHLINHFPISGGFS